MIQSFEGVVKQFHLGLITEEQIHDLYGSDVMERVLEQMKIICYQQNYA